MTPGAFAGDISPTPLLMILPDDALTAAPLTGSGHPGDARDCCRSLKMSVAASSGLSVCSQ
jgi:hypothetical protein